MKKVLVLIVLFVSLSAFAQSNEQASPFPEDNFGISFCNGKDLPDPLFFLPAPPQRGDARWVLDSVCYVQGKALRDTPRGEQAVRDADATIDYYFSVLGKILGKELNEKDYPELTFLLKGAFTDTRASIQHVKKTIARHRPYQDFGEHTPVPSDESPTDFTSYPSGHTVRAWSTALLMSTIDPGHSAEYYTLAYEIGQSRVILGFHYQSDVDAGRLSASAAYARLLREQAFLDQMEKARKELGL